MLGSADLLAQLSGRCYLEKCSDRLYDESDSAKQHTVDLKIMWDFKSLEDLSRKTSAFFQYLMVEMLNGYFQSVYEYAHRYLGGGKIYLDWIEKNYGYPMKVIRVRRPVSLLRHKPPWTLRIRPESLGLT